MSKFITAAAMATFAGSAFAQNQITFSYSDLSASFTNGTRVFNAAAVAPASGFQTGGDVSRIDTAPAQTAGFATGFRGASTADISVFMSVGTVFTPDLLGRLTVQGTGSLTITDVDSDTITGTINGIWTDLGNGFDSFQGLITGATLNPLGAGDNAHFNGLTGQFDYAGLAPVLNGTLVELQLTNSIFFNGDFSGVTSQTSGVLVPGPSSLALLGLGGLIAARRRRA